MGGTDQPTIFDVLGLLWGSIALRPYVFGFLGVYLLAATAAWGRRRAIAFTVWSGSLAFAAEWSSTRVGIPFGLYHYTGATAGRELYVSNVPFFDFLSFPFLAYASLGLAGHLLGMTGGASPDTGGDGGGRRGPGARLGLAGLSGLLMMGLDVVIDPLAVRGDRWFLGRIFYYPEPGWYFGVPIANFVGWAILGAVIAGGWTVLSPWVGGDRPAWGERWPGHGRQAAVLYYLVLAFNLAITAAVAERALLAVGVALHVPLAAVVVSSLRSREQPGPAPARAGAPRLTSGEGSP
jgi:putative membrane protein